jgi:hypothetical protein
MSLQHVLCIPDPSRDCRRDRKPSLHVAGQLKAMPFDVNSVVRFTNRAT